MGSYGNLCKSIPIIYVIALSGCSTRLDSVTNHVSADTPKVQNSTTPSPPPVQQPQSSVVQENAPAVVTPILPTKNEVVITPAPVTVPTQTIVSAQKVDKYLETSSQAPPKVASPRVSKSLAKPNTTVAQVSGAQASVAQVSGTQKLVSLEKKAPPTTPKIPEIPSESQKEPVTEPVLPATAPEPEVIIDFDDMPIKIQNWVLDYQIIPNTNHIDCILRSDTQHMDDGEGGTPVFLLFNQNSLKVVTKSNIDLEYADDGLQIDLHPQRPIDRLQKENTAIFEQNWSALLNEMLNGRQAVITFGFWPTWPMSRTYSISFDLAHFPRAWQAFQSCQQKA